MGGGDASMETESALPVDSSIPNEKPVDSRIELTTNINEYRSRKMKLILNLKQQPLLQQKWMTLVAHEGFRRYLASLQPHFELEDMEVYTLNL